MFRDTGPCPYPHKYQTRLTKLTRNSLLLASKARAYSTWAGISSLVGKNRAKLDRPTKYKNSPERQRRRKAELITLAPGRTTRPVRSRKHRDGHKPEINHRCIFFEQNSVWTFVNVPHWHEPQLNRMIWRTLAVTGTPKWPFTRENNF